MRKNTDTFVLTPKPQMTDPGVEQSFLKVRLPAQLRGYCDVFCLADYIADPPVLMLSLSARLGSFLWFLLIIPTQTLQRERPKVARSLAPFLSAAFRQTVWM